MPQFSDEDVIAIKEWISKEPYLPKDFNDIMIQKFVFSCNGSLEATKRCIEEFCTGRSNMTEIFTNRDPQSAKLKTAFSLTCVTTYIAGTDEILIHKITEVENFDFYDCVKSFTIQADNWILLERDVLPENHIVILDIKEYTFMLIAKANIFYFQKFILYLLAAMPVRLKEIHVVNCPSYYEQLYNMVKGALPLSTREMINFHSDHMGLHKFIDKKYLPSEYDGDAESMAKQNSYWINEISGKSKFYQNNNLWKADLSKKPKNGAVDTAMSGSFRTLAID